MGKGPAKEITCHQCGLPLKKENRKRKGWGVGSGDSPLPQPSDTDTETNYPLFCCTGCLIVYKITGSTGEEGMSQALLGKFGLGMLLSMNVMMLSAPFYAGIYASIKIPENFASPIKYILLVLTLPVIIVLGYPILKSSIDGLKRGMFGTESIILIGAVSAFVISVKSTLAQTGEIYYEIAAMTLTLYTLGHYLDSRARHKASESIRGLASLVPDEITVVRPDGSSKIIALDEAEIGDRVIIRHNQRIPLDGIIITGEGHVDESFLTGESRPVYKTVGAEVFSGSINIDGTMTVEVRKSPEEFLIKRIERLMERVRKNPSRIRRISDRISSIFVPFIITLSIGCAFNWLIKGDVSTAVMRMLALLLISCPCAFGIAAPLALWRGMGEAASHGAIIMGSDVLEGLSKIKTIFFDKTGTLTDSIPTLSHISPVSDLSEVDLLRIAASLEVHFNHPLAASIVKKAHDDGLTILSAEDTRNNPGIGIEGTINDERFLIGSIAAMESAGITIKPLERGIEENETSVYIARGREMVGCLLFTQTLRSGAKFVFDWCRSHHIKTVILTGDDERGINEIVKAVGPDEIKWGLLPKDKVLEIESQKGRTVSAMVGDGVNDAPALEASHIGIAMGCGTELTRESAKVNLLSNDLALIPYIIILSSIVKRKVYMNFFWAFIYNLIGLGLAINGTITPLYAVIAMIVSSLIVIGNSARL